jgi:glycosyltransferase involved in cell wall biosynthesis
VQRSGAPDPFGAVGRPSLAIFDYEVTETSPSGSCHLRLLEGLRHEFDFTVFATVFDNPDPSRISWVRVPAVRRPLAVFYLSYYLASAVALRRRGLGSFDLVQAVEGYTHTCDVSYVHYCHRAFLRRSGRPSLSGGPRGLVRYLDHRLRSLNEQRALERPRLLVTPSFGLIEELATEYGVDPARTRVVPNPVDLDRFALPTDFSRELQRAEIGAGPDDLVVAFVALGHFERKGLPELLDAMRLTSNTSIRLLVVGGERDLVASYRSRAAREGLDGRVTFVGMQADVRPYLWAADAFASPSSYEVFSLAPMQAAAAGLPLLVTSVPGVAPFFRDPDHGFTVTRDPVDISDALLRLAGTSPDGRRAMGAQARTAVEPYGVPQFIEGWRAVYRELLSR